MVLYNKALERKFSSLVYVSNGQIVYLSLAKNRNNIYLSLVKKKKKKLSSINYQDMTSNNNLRADPLQFFC